MGTFTEELAGQALSRLARQRASSQEVAMPADVCLFAWLAAEAARRGSNPITTNMSQMARGFTDELGKVDRVGLSLSTIHTSVARLHEAGFIKLEAGKVVARGYSQMIVTIC